MKKLLNGVLWEGTPDSGYMALTFDDGPDPEITPRVLDALEEAHARGTFFLLGERVKRYPETARSISERGHLLGSHSMTHPRLFLMRRTDVEVEVDESRKAIYDATGKVVSLFRPPYGIFDFTVARVLREREMDLVLWSVLSGDYSGTSEAEVFRRIWPFLRPGAILVFHDTKQGGGHGLESLVRSVCAEALKRGVRLGGVDELSIAGEISLGGDNVD